MSSTLKIMRNSRVPFFFQEQWCEWPLTLSNSIKKRFKNKNKNLHKPTRTEKKNNNNIAFKLLHLLWSDVIHINRAGIGVCYRCQHLYEKFCFQLLKTFINLQQICWLFWMKILPEKIPNISKFLHLRQLTTWWSDFLRRNSYETFCFIVAEWLFCFFKTSTLGTF